MEVSFQCTQCKNVLTIGGAAEALGDQASTSERPPESCVSGAAAGSTGGMNESFVVLDERRGGTTGGGTTAGSSRGLGESFVLLKDQAQQQGAEKEGEEDGSLMATLEALERIFELASQETEVDHPLCLECSEKLQGELDEQLAEAETEVLAYEDCLQRLLDENVTPMDDEAFEEDMKQHQEQEEAERKRGEELEKELEAAMGEAEQLEQAAKELDALEDRYWHDFNDYEYQLRAHVEERDALLSKIQHAEEEYERLKGKNPYNDAFHIWYDGPFGTISGFRLGRTPTQPVDWTEINSAWGQAVLLLHTMANACGCKFSSYRLLPMGSHPRIADKKNTYDLFGPPKMWGSNYDKGMVCFLACLQEFADFATNEDVAHGRESPFDIPYPIEADKVGGMSVKLTFNKETRWTKALKHMLADLKLCLRWMTEVQEFGGGNRQPAEAASQSNEAAGTASSSR